MTSPDQVSQVMSLWDLDRGAIQTQSEKIQSNKTGAGGRNPAPMT
jgi:hypothetical protein